MVTFSYSACHHLGIELYESKSPRWENSEQRPRMAQGLRPEQPCRWELGGVDRLRNNPIFTGAWDSKIFLNFHVPMGLQVTCLPCLLRGQAEDGHGLRQTEVTMQGPRIIAQVHLTCLLGSACVICISLLLPIVSLRQRLLMEHLSLSKTSIHVRHLCGGIWNYRTHNRACPALFLSPQWGSSVSQPAS